MHHKDEPGYEHYGEEHHHGGCGCGHHGYQSQMGGGHHSTDCGCGGHHGHHAHGFEGQHHGRGFGPGFKRRFISKEEIIARLKEYLNNLQAEAKGVEEHIAELRKNET